MKNVYTYLETGLNQFCNVTNTIPVLRGIGTVFVLLNQQNLSAPPHGPDRNIQHEAPAATKEKKYLVKL